jgi:hypothetical protein
MGLPGLGTDYIPASGERTRRGGVNKLDYKGDHFELNGVPIEVEPLAYSVKIGCHLVSYHALRQLVTRVKRRGPIEALDG